MQRNWTRHWMKPVEWSQDVWSRQIPTVCPYSPESPHQTSGERWQVVRNGHGKLRTKGTHSMDISEWCHASNCGRALWHALSQSTRLRKLPVWSYGARLEPLDARVHLDISADEHLPAGAEKPWKTWKALNRLRTQVGRSRVNMLKWGFSTEPETCDCGTRQTMQHLLVCPMMDTTCSPQDLITDNDIAIGCARHWEGTILLTYDSWWKDKNDDDWLKRQDKSKPQVAHCSEPESHFCGPSQPNS